jgi:RNA recognition motif-containing protein
MVKWDVDTQQSKGCGFVSFDTDEAADKAISEMHMSEFYGRKIKVHPAVSFVERANKKRLRDESFKKKKEDRERAKAEEQEVQRIRNEAYMANNKDNVGLHRPRNKCEKKVCKAQLHNQLLRLVKVSKAQKKHIFP